MKKIIMYSLLSIVVGALLWAVWGFASYWFTSRIDKLQWWELIWLPILCLWLASRGDKLLILLNQKSLTSTKSVTPLFWAWLPALTMGVAVVLYPIRFAIITCGIYGFGYLGFSGWFALACLTLFPILSLISIIKTPLLVRKAMRTPEYQRALNDNPLFY